MTPLRVLIHNDQTRDMAAALRARFPQVECLECASYKALPQMLAKHAPVVVYAVRFDGSDGYPRDTLFAKHGPAWIANGGAGTDHFGQWDPSRVTVTNAAGVAADMMAEYIIGGFLHFTLDVPGLQEDQRKARWAARTVRPLKGQTLLIVGLGHTGRALAARAHAFGMRVIGTRATPQAMEHLDHVGAAEDLPKLLPQADFIAICTPLTAQTKGLIGDAEIASMRKGAVLADVSRGGVVDQTALAQALAKRRIAAAVLDVFEVEPLPTQSPFWQMENVLVSPHCSSVHAGWEGASFALFLDNLERWIKGDPLSNIVDPVRGY